MSQTSPLPRPLTRRAHRLLPILLATSLLAACSGGESAPPPAPPHAAPARAGFVYASPDRVLKFPSDYGGHPDYQTEWWYYTGNVEDQAGRHFGYQLTFFRRSIKPPSETTARDVPTAATDIYMGHLALTDSSRGVQRAFERFSRGAEPVAGVRSSPHAIWLDDWRVETEGDGRRRLVAAQDGIALDLSLQATKGPILHGRGGYSRKGSDPNRASHYYSFPRLATRGSITVDGQRHRVAGASWMDHEFTSSGLADDQIGWDWFSIQLDNGVELMLFHLRTADGGVDPYSSGSVIAADGTVEALARENFSIDATAEWKSPRTDARYPAEWRIRIRIASSSCRSGPTSPTRSSPCRSCTGKARSRSAARSPARSSAATATSSSPDTPTRCRGRSEPSALPTHAPTRRLP